MGIVVCLLLKLTHGAKTQVWVYILCLFEAVYISPDLTLEKKGLECSDLGVPAVTCVPSFLSINAVV